MKRLPAETAGQTHGPTMGPVPHARRQDVEIGTCLLELLDKLLVLPSFLSRLTIQGVEQFAVYRILKEAAAC